MGKVYRAHDTKLKRDVAVKLMSTDRLGTDGRERMVREAQAIAKLNHPNIVVVHDVGEHDDTPFIVMELVEGNNLHSHLLQSYDEITAAAKQICAALVHAHKNKIVHRDLKPENMIIDAEGTVKLMDFGLAHTVASRISTEGIVGTVFYMAPEQAMGKELDGRADLYALGVVLYELVTGELPFEASDPVAVISQHLHAPLVPPLAKKEDIPAFLNNLIIKLLSKKPQDRPESAKDVLAILENPDSSQLAPSEDLTVLDRIVRGKIVGRESEFEEARDLWKNVEENSGQLLLVSGEPGVGKTRFTREVVTHAEVSGGMALQGASYTEGGIPYAPFRQILRKALRSQLGHGLKIPESALKNLLSLVPELRSSYPNLKLEEKTEPPIQAELFENFLIFFEMLCAQTPLMLVLEDVHWADSGSLSLMRHLARMVRDSRLMILATYREIELDEARPFHTVLLDMEREKIGTRIKLARFDLERTRSLLKALLAAENISDEFAESVFRETEGNPFFIEEVCKALAESGKLFFKDGNWDRLDIEELGIPQGVRVAIQARVGKLDQDAQEILRQAAFLGREFSFDALKRASELSEDDLIDVIERAERAQLIEEIDGDVEEMFAFVHALIPATLIESVRTVKRRQLHRRAAQALEITTPGNWDVLAFHYVEGGEMEKAIPYLLQAG
ncbi:MAG: protein kinase, partial [Chloroflexota bacterium]